MYKFKTHLPVLSCVLVSVIFGFSFLITKEALDVFGPYQLIGFRFAAAALFLTVLRLLGIIKINLKGKKVGQLILLTLFQPILYFIFETNGINLTTASISGIIISLIPIAVTIIAGIMLRERATAIQLLFILLSVAGVAFIVVTGGGMGSGGHFMGIVLLVGAVVSAGFYNVMSRKLSGSYTPIEITYCMMWVGAIAFNLVSFIRELAVGNPGGYFDQLTNVKAVGALIYLAVISSILAFFLLNYSLSKMEASRVAVVLNIVPVISVFAGVVFRNEVFYPAQIIGGVLILAGVWGTNKYSGKTGDESARIEVTEVQA